MTELTETRDAFSRMDAMYRHQRHFYDATRKFYLLGRDRMINKLELGDCDKVAEIGCGTGRNLRILAERFPTAMFYGIDASSQMLEKAASNLRSANVGNVRFRCELAENFSTVDTLGIDRPLDSVIFSYSVSMIPKWKQAIMAALSNVRKGGQIFIVDFYDQEEFPTLFRYLLRSWLRQFDVRFWSELIPFLRQLERDGEITLSVESVARRYAFIATLEKRGKV